MEQYLYIFRGGDENRDAQSPEEWQAHMQKWGAWMSGLAEKGILLGGEPLDNAGKVVNGKQKVISDGPFVELKETIGGYLVVQAASLDAATELALGCPLLEHDGRVEVRQIKHFDMP